MDETRIRQIFQEELARLLGADHFIFRRHIEIGDGRNIQTGRTTGTKIGTAIDQKIGFFGKAPVAQQAAPTDAASIIVLLKAYGLSA
jgi:hypothetical protein